MILIARVLGELEPSVAADDDEDFELACSLVHFSWTMANAQLTAEQFMKHIIYVHRIATEITSDQDV